VKEGVPGNWTGEKDRYIIFWSEFSLMGNKTKKIV